MLFLIGANMALQYPILFCLLNLFKSVLIPASADILALAVAEKHKTMLQLRLRNLLVTITPRDFGSTISGVQAKAYGIYR